MMILATMNLAFCGIVIALTMPFAVLVCAVEMGEDAFEHGARAWVESI
jgi:hypothetical protein